MRSEVQVLYRPPYGRICAGTDRLGEPSTGGSVDEREASDGADRGVVVLLASIGAILALATVVSRSVDPEGSLVVLRSE